MPLRAVVFDFDGVIANTEPLHLQSYRDVLADHAIELREADYYARYLGYDDVGAFRAIGADHGRAFDAETIDALVTRKAARMEQLERDSRILFPGAADAVRRLARSFPLAIASGALRAEIERVLHASALATCFVAVVAAGDTVSGKPAPDPYLRAVALLDRVTGAGRLLPADCVAIEDSRWGLESARAAGLRTVAVTQSYPASALSPYADLVLATLDELAEPLLNRIFNAGPPPESPPRP